jgi:hypothetical protein
MGKYLVARKVYPPIRRSGARFLGTWLRIHRQGFKPAQDVPYERDGYPNIEPAGTLK